MDEQELFMFKLAIGCEFLISICPNRLLTIKTSSQTPASSTKDSPLTGFKTTSIFLEEIQLKSL